MKYKPSAAEPKLYTEKALSQVIEAVTEKALLGFAIAKDYASSKSSYADLGQKYGISHEAAANEAQKVRGVLFGLNNRKVKKHLRKIKVEVDPEAVKVTVAVVLVGLLIGLAGHSDAVACEVSKGIICP